MRQLICILALLWIGVVPVWAGYLEGMQAYQNGAYTTALEELQPLAEQGNATVQALLANMYLKGLGVPREPTRAQYWFHKAAAQGNPQAQVGLGLLCFQGIGGQPTEAVAWFRRAARRGHPEAYSNLGTLYAKGRGVEQDYSQAVQWYRKAANTGIVQAQYNLGQLYAAGHGVARDPIRAYKWYQVAVSQLPSGKERDRVVRLRRELARQMSPRQITQAERLASEWRPGE